MKKFIDIIKILLSIITLISYLYLTDNLNNKNMILSPVNIILFIFIIVIYKKYLVHNKDVKKNIIKCLWLFSIFFSIVTTFGYNYTMYDSMRLNYIMTYFSMISITTFTYTIFNIILSNHNKIKEKFENKNFNRIENFLKDKVFVKSFILIILAWIPILLAFYPGIFSYDSSVQLKEYLNNDLTNANPVIHTILIGKCLIIGSDIFQNYNVGVFIYSIIQMTFLAGTLAYIIHYVCKRNLNKVIILALLLFFMFNPAISTMAVTTTKDVIFSALVVLVIIKTIDMVLYTEEFFCENKIEKTLNIIKYIVLVFFMMIFRHNGYYGFIFLIIPLIIVLRKKFIYVAICCIVPFTMYYGYISAINANVLKHKNSISESVSNAILCIPLQQMARVYNNKEIDEKEKSIFDYWDGTNPDFGFKHYELRKADKVRDGVKIDKIVKEKELFIQDYIYLGLKYPIEYIDAFNQNILGYFYINDLMPDKSTYRVLIEVRCVDDFDITYNEIKFESKLPFIFDLYTNMFEKGEYQNIPIISTILQPALYTLILIFIIMLNIFTNNKKMNIPYILIIGLMITNIFGPVALFRYTFYNMLLLPIFILNCYQIIRNAKEEIGDKK